MCLEIIHNYERDSYLNSLSIHLFIYSPNIITYTCLVTHFKQVTSCTTGVTEIYSLGFSRSFEIFEDLSSDYIVYMIRSSKAKTSHCVAYHRNVQQKWPPTGIYTHFMPRTNESFGRL